MKWFQKLLLLPKADGKLKAVFILFLIGILLLLLPTAPKKQTSDTIEMHTMNEKVPKELEKLLTELTGNKVRVLLSYRDAGELEVISEESIISQSEEENRSTKLQTDKKPLLDSNKNIMIKNRKQPAIKGVCIIYFGTAHPDTVSLLHRAAKGALGTELHQIEVICAPS